MGIDMILVYPAHTLPIGILSPNVQYLGLVCLLHGEVFCLLRSGGSSTCEVPRTGQHYWSHPSRAQTEVALALVFQLPEAFTYNLTMN